MEGSAERSTTLNTSCRSKVFNLVYEFADYPSAMSCANSFLPAFANCREFLSADLIAAGLAIKRVAKRVREGGHNIPEAVVRRRYARGLANLIDLYIPIITTVCVYDGASFPPIPPTGFDRKRNDGTVESLLYKPTSTFRAQSTTRHAPDDVFRTGSIEASSQ
jgi:hypothetical protein